MEYVWTYQPAQCLNGSIFVNSLLVKDMKAGEIHTEDSVRSIGLCCGVYPHYIKGVAGVSGTDRYPAGNTAALGIDIMSSVKGESYLALSPLSFAAEEPR